MTSVHMQIRVRGELPDPEAIRDGLARGLERWLEDVKASAKFLAPRRTGALAASMRVSVRRTGKGVRARLLQKFYGQILEAGAEPHEITAKPGKLLRFTIGDKVIFTRKVQHPGFAPRPYLRPTVERKLPVLKTTVEDVLNPIFNRPRIAHG